MKIRITENTKKQFYMSEMNCIEIAEKTMEESNWITKDDIQTFANLVGFNVTVLKAEAEYAKNNRVYDRFGEGSEHTDVWVSFTGYNGWNTFYIAGAYLSDIWEIGAVDCDELKKRMYIRVFKEQ